MSSGTSRLTSFLQRAPLPVFTGVAIAASFSTYFCMYAFRKPFAAASFLSADGSAIKFWDTAIDLKTALVISQIIGYALSKYIGIKFCTEVRRERRAGMLMAMILAALTALVIYGLLPVQWKFVAIFFAGIAPGDGLGIGRLVSGGPHRIGGPAGGFELFVYSCQWHREEHRSLPDGHVWCE